jgi:predicted Zn-dependent protease
VYRNQLYAHNLHFAFASAGMAGDAGNALGLAKRLEGFLATGVIQRPDFYAAAALMPRVKFAGADEILALAEPPEAAIYPRGIRLYARASAHVMRDDVAAAREELAALTALRTDTDPDTMMQSGGRTPQMLQLAEAVVMGRIAVEEKKWDEAVKHFTAAAVIQDGLRSFDPPVWDFPLRQAVGLTLLKAGKTNEAIEALRSALQDAPNNGTVLYALAQASKAAGDDTAAAQYTILFKKAWVGEGAPDLDRI